MVVTSVSFWKNLPPDIRNELSEILNEVTLKVNELTKEKELFDKKIITENPDVEVITLGKKEREQWRKAMIPLWSDFENEIGEEIMAAAKGMNGNQ